MKYLAFSSCYWSWPRSCSPSGWGTCLRTPSTTPSSSSSASPSWTSPQSTRRRENQGCNYFYLFEVWFDLKILFWSLEWDQSLYIQYTYNHLIEKCKMRERIILLKVHNYTFPWKLTRNKRLEENDEIG